MEQFKKKSYNHYINRTTILTKTAIKVASNNVTLAKQLKKQSEQQIMSECYKQYPDMISSLDSVIIGDELAWEEQGRNIIYPESADLIDHLLDAKFDASTIDYLQLPFSKY